MKLTEKDIKLFQSLNSSETGRSLVDYLERLSSWICDIRNLKDEDAPLARSIGNFIKINIIDQIQLLNQPKKRPEPNQFE